jgi:hypothetical protein
MDFATVDVWVGVKAPDDEEATYDLQAVISRNAADLASGQALCISGLSRDAASARRVSIPLSSLAHAASGPVSLKLSVRIGTDSSGGRCANGRPTPAAASGLRIYFDSLDRASAVNAAPATPVNAAPVVDAGSNQTITLPAAATLGGSVKDDGLPARGSLTSTWSKTSGPGTVTFANPATPATTATFSQAGQYALRLTASDTEKTAYAEVTITVNPATSTNRPPLFTSSPDTNAKHQIAYSYQPTASDPDGDPLTFSLGSAPSGMTIGASGLFSGRPREPDWPAAGNRSSSPTARTHRRRNPSRSSWSMPPHGRDAVAAGEAAGTSVRRPLANDNVGVTSVRFEVNSGDPRNAAAPFQRMIAVPGTAVAGTEFHIHAIARDATGNTADADRTFKVPQRRHTAGAHAERPPEAALAGTIVQLTAAAADATGVKSVTFKPPRRCSSSIPSAVRNHILCRRMRRSARRSTSRRARLRRQLRRCQRHLVVAATPDRTPPTVQLIRCSNRGRRCTRARRDGGRQRRHRDVRFFVNGVRSGRPRPRHPRLCSNCRKHQGVIRCTSSSRNRFRGPRCDGAQETQVLAAPNRAPVAAQAGPAAVRSASRFS